MSLLLSQLKHSNFTLIKIKSYYLTKRYNIKFICAPLLKNVETEWGDFCKSI